MRKVIPNEVRIPAISCSSQRSSPLLRMVLEKFLPDIYSASRRVPRTHRRQLHHFGGARRRLPTSTPCPKPPWTGLANGIGFTLALTCMGIVCEVLGSGSSSGQNSGISASRSLRRPAGSFIIFGLSIALFTKVMDSVMGNARSKRQAEEARRALKRAAAPPQRRHNLWEP